MGNDAALFQLQWPNAVRSSEDQIALHLVRLGDPVGKRPQASDAQSYP